MKVLVFGKSGQVAQELQRRAPDEIEVTALGRGDADFTKPEMVMEVAGSADADLFINAAAYTAVDKAREEPEIARLINETSVEALAHVAAMRDLPLIHISTDYVFDGSGDAPRTPYGPTGPLGVYGATKLAGETALRRSGARAVVLRTSWVFSAHGANFVKTMLRLGGERDRLTIVSDQVGGPTPAADIADAAFFIAKKLSEGKRGGIYHFSGAPDVSWADFAREIFAQTGMTPDVVDIPTTEFPTPEQRPLNSRLDCSSLKSDFGIARPDWKAGLAKVLAELGK